MGKGYCAPDCREYCLSTPSKCFHCPEAWPAGVAVEIIGRDPAPPLAPAAPPQKRLIDADSATRKTFPMFSGLLAYFPDALAAVAHLSFDGNEKHNPGEPLHHARGKSTDHADCIVRHLVNHGGFDGKTRESAALAWRALALLQEELERELNLPLPRGARP